MQMRPMRFVGAAALGAGLAYFLDPQSGAQRRNTFRDKLTAKARSGAGEVAGAARGAGSQVGGMAQKAAAAVRDSAPPPNDETLKHKVQSDVIGPSNIPSGQINVDVSEGIVALRGQVDHRETMQELHAKVRKIEGVRDVQNLLHLPGEPPPNLAPVAGSG